MRRMCTTCAHWRPKMDGIDTAQLVEAEFGAWRRPPQAGRFCSQCGHSPGPFPPPHSIPTPLSFRSAHPAQLKQMDQVRYIVPTLAPGRRAKGNGLKSDGGKVERVWVHPTPTHRRCALREPSDGATEFLLDLPTTISQYLISVSFLSRMMLSRRSHPIGELEGDHCFFSKPPHFPPGPPFFDR